MHLPDQQVLYRYISAWAIGTRTSMDCLFPTKAAWTPQSYRTTQSRYSPAIPDYTAESCRNHTSGQQKILENTW